MPLPRRSIQLLIVLALSIAGCKSRSQAPIPDGDVVAALPAKTIDGKPFDPASLKGKPSIVMFASPSCGFCMQEMPLAQNAAQTKNGNAVVVFVSGTPIHGQQAASKQGFTGTVLMDDGTLKKKYKIRGVPYTVVTKADGTAQTAFAGMTDESTLASALDDAR